MYRLRNELNLEICVFSYDEQASGIQFAKGNKLQHHVVEKGANNHDLSANLLSGVEEFSPDLCLLLFDKLLKGEYLQNAQFPTLNIHPSILPAFPGFLAVDQAIEYGVRFTGVTIHYVDGSTDQGPVIIQSMIPIDEHVHVYADIADILRDHFILISTQTVSWFQQRRVELNGRKVNVLNSFAKGLEFLPNIEKNVFDSCEEQLSKKYFFIE